MITLSDRTLIDASQTVLAELRKMLNEDCTSLGKRKLLDGEWPRHIVEATRHLKEPNEDMFGEARDKAMAVERSVCNRENGHTTYTCRVLSATKDLFNY